MAVKKIRIKDAINTGVKIFNFFVIGLISLSVIVISFLNSSELIFGRDITSSQAIEKFKSTFVLNELINLSKNGSIVFTTEAFSVSRELVFIEIPILERKLELSKAINESGEWLTKGNKANYFLLNFENQDALVVYINQGWRTITNQNLAKEGDLIFLTTKDDWSYVFRINEIFEHSNNSIIIPQKFNKLGIIFIISQDNSFTYMQADLINSRRI